VAWIDGHAKLKGKRVIDVGCGGGLLSEGMAALGAEVTGIDLSEKALGIARLHLYESGHAIDYRLIAAETMATRTPAAFDVVTCLEMLEHVPDPASTVAPAPGWSSLVARYSCPRSTAMPRPTCSP
jgi:2-polyprenyl-6-hydroxyphenyl methylase/3-demethylubiquinone-9 3-methyltransferase